MADYGADIIQVSSLDLGLDPKPIDVTWFLSSGVSGPPSVGSPVTLFPLITKAGHEAIASYLACGGKPFVSAKVSWDPGAVEEEFYIPAVGNGGASYTFVLRHGPIVPGTVHVQSNGASLVDDGDGNLTGNGKGSIDYETGDVQVTFDTPVPAGGNIEAFYQHFGRHGPFVDEDGVTGDGTAGPFSGSVSAIPVLEGSFSLSNWNGLVVWDDGSGNLVGEGSGTIDYESGSYTVTFASATQSGVTFRATYRCASWPAQPITVGRSVAPMFDANLSLSAFGNEVQVEVEIPAGLVHYVSRVSLYSQDGAETLVALMSRRATFGGRTVTMRLKTPEAG